MLIIVEDTRTDCLVTVQTTTIINILTGRAVIQQDTFVLGMLVEEVTTFLL